MKNKLFLIFICLILLSISTVSAGDINQTNIDEIDNSVLSTSNDVIVDTISASENDNLTSKSEHIDANILNSNFDFNTLKPTFKFISIKSNSNDYNYNFITSVSDTGRYNVKYVLTSVDGNKVVLNNLTNQIISYTLTKPLKNLDVSVEGYEIQFDYPLTALKLILDYTSPSDYITLSHDYSWVDGIDTCTAGGYFFSFNNKIIDGNGYTINGLSETTFKKDFGPVPKLNYHDWNLINLGNNAILKNINLINFTYDKYGYVNGGMIYVSGTNVTLSNVNITNAVNTAYSYETESGYGGAIIWDGNGGLIDKCNIINCHGGQYGTVTILKDNIVMNNCVIDNASVANWIDESIGAAAIRWDGNNGTLINTLVKNSKRSDSVPNNQYRGTVSFTKKPNLIENVIITNSSIGPDLMVLGMPVEDYMGKNVQFESDFIKLTPETITLNNNIFTVKSVRSGTVTYVIDDKITKTTSVDKNGQFILDYSFNPSQNYLIKVTYNGNKYYNSYTKYFGYNIGNSESFASFTDLYNLISSSSSSIIDLEKNYVYDPIKDSDLANGIIISKDITINGNNHYIDADYNPVRIFTTNVNIVLNNLTFKNSRLNSSGNAILANNAISINYCTFDNNWASGQIGGAVNLNGGNSYVKYCTFTNNKAKTGAAIAINSENNYILYSLFKGNEKDYGGNMDYGSAISLAKGKTSYVNNNALLDYRPLNQISNSYCRNNWYGSNDLPDSSEDGAPSIPNYLKADLDYTIKKNVLTAKILFTESDTGKIVDVDFQRPVYYIINSNLTVSDTSNSISYQINGNTHINALVDNQRLTVNQGNLWYVNGSVSSSGSGNESSPYKTLKYAINNAEDGDTIYVAPGIYTGSSNVGLTISKAVTIERWGDTGEVIFDGQQNNYGIFTLNSNIIISSITFMNSTKRYGGAITINKDSIIIESIFMNNNASEDGGAIYITSGGANILNSKFINNHATYNGGAIAGDNINMTICNSIFENNTAAKGGAINGEGSESYINVIDSIFQNNIADSYGGALASNGEGNVAYSSFINNIAVLGGGAVYIWGNSHYITNSLFINNYATYGGAIINLYADLFLDNSHFNNNNAFAFGGAVYKSYGDLLIFKSDFSNNYAYYDGGAAYVHKNISSVFESLFKRNMANYGGGAIHSISSNLSYSGSYMLNNISTSSNGYIYTEYINSFIDFGNYTMVVANTSNYNGKLPSYFNLVDNGWDTSVKNQGDLDICWDYSVIATVETAIKKATGIEVDLSENNVKNLISKYSMYGTSREPNEGGTDWEALSYLANSLGPVFENTDSISAFGFSPLLKKVFHISNIGLAERSRSNPLDNDEVKEAIIKYGAVKASISMDDSYKGNYNYYHSRNIITNHAVAIVGWDDNYPVSNFPDGCPGKGAWIVKNSWGPDWCDDGYFHVSYYDQSFAWIELHYIMFNDTIRYDRVYQYDFSNRYSMQYASYYKNVYNSVKNEALSGFSTYFDKALNWEVFVYVGDELRHIQNGSSISAGYFTFNFDKKIPVSKGEQFTVCLKVNNTIIPYVYKSDLNSNPGDAGISYYSMDGKTWIDLDTANEVACLKVFTQNMNGSLIKINPIANVTYNSPITVGFDIENKTKVSYIVKNNEEKVIINKTYLIGKNQIILSNLAVGDYIITIFNEANEKFTGDVKSAAFTINKAINNVEVIVDNKILPGDVIVKVNADINGIYNVSIGDKSVNVNVKSGYGENIISLPANLNYVTNTSCDTQNYTVNIKEAKFNVTKSINNIKIMVENTTYPNNVTIKLTADIKGTYIVDINGTEYELIVKNNGETVSKSILLAPNNYLANITKYYHDIYDAKITTSNFKVTGLNIINISASDVIKSYGDSDQFIVTLTKDGSPFSNAEVKISLNGNTYYRTTDDDGKVYLSIYLDSGVYNAVITYLGSGLVPAKVVKITVKALDTETELSYVKNSRDSVTLMADVNQASVSGNIVFDVNGKEYVSEISNSKASYTLYGLESGLYTVKAYYGGDINHESSTSNIVSFTIDSNKVNISAPDLIKYYNGNERFVVILKDKDNKAIVDEKVSITINGMEYTRTTNSNGEASMAINLNCGVYPVTTEYKDQKIDSKVTVISTILGKDITKIFRNDTQYYATFLDNKGNFLKNKDVTFNINGVFYTRTTNDKGVAKLNINLGQGDYIITAKNPVTGEQRSNIVKVLPSIIENNDITKYYKNDTQYLVKVLNLDGSVAGAGVNVTFNINGVFYTRTTNASGYAKLNINLAPGEYIITAEYNGLKVSNKIKVLPVLSAGDLSMSFRDGSKFEAKLLDGQGNVYASQTIKFNINGVFYGRTTDANGIAKLNINLMSGKYIITSMYNGAAIANEITIS